MAIGLYEYDVNNSQYVEHSRNGILTNPVQTTHDGTNGEVAEKKLYLRNDNAAFYYSNMTIQPLPLTKTGVGDINYPEAFVTFKIIVQEEQPSANQWRSVQSGSEVTFPNIGVVGSGDTNYKPFWIQTSVPAGTSVQNISDISIHLEGEENPV
jgi:hypothetical protein